MYCARSMLQSLYGATLESCTRESGHGVLFLYSRGTPFSSFSSRGELAPLTDKLALQSPRQIDVCGPRHYGGQDATTASGGHPSASVNTHPNSINKATAKDSHQRKRRRASDDDDSDEDEDDDDEQDGDTTDHAKTTNPLLAGVDAALDQLHAEQRQSQSTSPLPGHKIPPLAQTLQSHHAPPYDSNSAVSQHLHYLMTAAQSGAPSSSASASPASRGANGSPAQPAYSAPMSAPPGPSHSQPAYSHPHSAYPGPSSSFPPASYGYPPMPTFPMQGFGGPVNMPYLAFAAAAAANVYSHAMNGQAAPPPPPMQQSQPTMSNLMSSYSTSSSMHDLRNGVQHPPHHSFAQPPGYSSMSASSSPSMEARDGMYRPSSTQQRSQPYSQPSTQVPESRMPPEGYGARRQTSTHSIATSTTSHASTPSQPSTAHAGEASSQQASRKPSLHVYTSSRSRSGSQYDEDGDGPQTATALNSIKQASISNNSGIDGYDGRQGTKPDADSQHQPALQVNGMSDNAFAHLAESFVTSPTQLFPEIYRNMTSRFADLASPNTARPGDDMHTGDARVESPSAMGADDNDDGGVFRWPSSGTNRP